MRPIVDKNGRLLRVYHGSKAAPTVFSSEFISTWNAFGKGFYFTEDKNRAKGYAKDGLYECYLNIINPFVTNNRDSLDLLYGKINKTRQSISKYSDKKGVGGSEFWQICNYIDDIGGDVSKIIRDLGFDGIIHDSYGTKELVVYDSNQIKLTTNKQPTGDADIRFALDSSEDGNAQPRGNYSVGQRARFVANNTGMRVYTKAEAAEVINSIIEERLVFEDIGMYGELRGKDRQAVIDYLFRKLNTVKEGYRGGVALRIADYMIEHTVLTDMYSESSGEVSEAMHTLSVLRRYMHKIDLRHIHGEIQYRFDKKNSINLVWGAKEGGIAPDTLPQLLAEEGIFLDAINEADCFLQMVDMYEDARAAVNNATEQVMLSTYGDARTIKNLRQQIARDVLNAYEQKGRKSKYAKLVEKYTKQIAELKQRLREANANNRLINSIVDQAQKMRDLKLGTFQNATQYDTEIFRSSIEKLGKIKFRGNFNIAGTRKIMADLRTWYTKDNPLLADSYEQGIADMLDEVANGKTNNYTKRELQSIRNIMA